MNFAPYFASQSRGIRVSYSVGREILGESDVTSLFSGPSVE